MESTVTLDQLTCLTASVVKRIIKNRKKEDEKNAKRSSAHASN